MLKSLVFPLEYHWNNSEKNCVILIPLTVSGITVNNSDFHKSHWNTNRKRWFTTAIPETFSMGYKCVINKVSANGCSNQTAQMHGLNEL